MARSSCPRCATIVEYVPPTMPICPNCGYGAQAAAATAQTPWPTPSAGGAAAAAAGSWAAAARRERPGMTTTAGVLAFVLGGLMVLATLGLLVVSGMDPDDPQVQRALAEQGLTRRQFVDAQHQIGPIAFVIAGLAAVLITGGVGVMRGRNWGRILLWVACGILGIGILISAVSRQGNAVGGFLIPSACVGFFLAGTLGARAAAWFAPRS